MAPKTPKSIHIEGISDNSVPDWQLNSTPDDQPYLPSDTEDEHPDVDINEEEEVDRGDGEEGYRNVCNGILGTRRERDIVEDLGLRHGE